MSIIKHELDSFVLIQCVNGDLCQLVICTLELKSVCIGDIVNLSVNSGTAHWMSICKERLTYAVYNLKRLPDCLKHKGIKLVLILISQSLALWLYTTRVLSEPRQFGFAFCQQWCLPVLCDRYYQDIVIQRIFYLDGNFLPVLVLFLF